VPSLIMIHSILRYGFLDIVLKRSLLYGVVGVELLGVYLVLAFLVRESFVGELAVAVPALHFVRTLGFAAILAGAVKPLREQCERMLDLTLFRRSTSFRGNLVQLGQHLPRTADTATLVVAVAEGLARALPVSGASVGVALERRWFTAAAGTLSAPEEAHMQALRRRLAGMGATDVTELADIELCRRLHAQGVDLVVPVGAADGNGGVILLGRKPSGAVFLGEERAFLDAFAVQVAAGLEHSQLLAAHLAMGRELAHAEQLAATGGLAARLAHEIRNPITAVKSLSQLIERDPTAPENVAHLRIVTQELDRVERRVAALLRLTRKEEYRFAAIDARELLHDVLEQFRGRLTDSGVQLAASPLPHVTVHGDAEKLRQVLGNLIQNAIEAMDGAAHRRLVIAADCADNGTLRISVADRGPGIPPEQAAHIFEPFYTTKENGTGLGLAIAKRIVDAHHGRLSVAANPEGGTIFRVELPVAVTSDE
jgi:signal transduction histidine kinase